MAQSRPEARLEIEKLVRYFADNIHQLKAPSFNEAQARQQLIDPFFEALGWDVCNRQMLAPYRLEVIPEGRVKTPPARSVGQKSPSVRDGEGEPIPEYIIDDEFKADQKMASKKPDYRFRVQGSTKFFVEAKRPSVDLMSNVDAIFQIKRYGFSARVPASILTDFEAFRVFDCTRKPFYDKPKVGVLREFDLTYTAYLDEFDKLYDTFSREAVVAGSIEALQTKYLQKRTGEFALDRSFLEDLSAWRVELAQDIAKHPQNRRILNTYTLNECVQRILDRIVFLRVCEDRAIEEVGTLVALLRLWQDHPGLSLYDKFNELIRQRRSLYNGLLFTEHECERLVVSNKILEKIFKNINYPLSPYHFDEIGVEILGSIYERFLGRTIRLTQKQVRVEEKPEVRKAGGVYYTPKYIVDYIVDNTLGRLLYGEPPVLARSPERTRGMTKQSDLPGKNQIASVAALPRSDTRRLLLSPKQVSKLKIIDIACGSGSFLLGAFQKLIDYHIEWYAQHPEDIKEVHGVQDVYEDAQGQLRLSSRKKREILINNIYGVDIDPQAVEVTQMSLYLKVLEDENDATLNKPTMLALHEVLLPPLKNNIKCGNSLIGTDFYAQGELFDEETKRKVNAFDWEMEFPFLNPSVPTEKVGTSPLHRRGDAAAGGEGFDVVIGNPPYGIDFSDDEKRYIRENYESYKYKYDSYHYFIERALTVCRKNGYVSYITPEIWLMLDNCAPLRKHIFMNGRLEKIRLYGESVFEDAVVNTIVFVARKGGASEACTIETEAGSWWIPFERIESSDKYTIEYRFKPELSGPLNKLRSDDIKPLSAFGDVAQGITAYDRYRGHTKDEIKSRVFHSKKKLSKAHGKWLAGGDVVRYSTTWSGEWLKYGPWLGAPRDPKFFVGPRILFREVPGGDKRIQATYVDKLLYHGHSITPFLPAHLQGHSILYALGVVNSKLSSWYAAIAFSNFGKDVFPKLNPQDIKQLPIRTIDFTDPAERQMHDELVALVDKMLELHKELNKVSFQSEKEPIQRQIAATDKKIDELVYKLYGLTEEEIKIVEGM